MELIFPISAINKVGILAESTVPLDILSAFILVNEAPEPENNGAFISLFETNLASACE